MCGWLVWASKNLIVGTIIDIYNFNLTKHKTTLQFFNMPNKKISVYTVSLLAYKTLTIYAHKDTSIYTHTDQEKETVSSSNKYTWMHSNSREEEEEVRKIVWLKWIESKYHFQFIAQSGSKVIQLKSQPDVDISKRFLYMYLCGIYYAI